MDGDTDSFFIGISSSIFQLEPKSFACLDQMISLLLSYEEELARKLAWKKNLPSYSWR